MKSAGWQQAVFLLMMPDTERSECLWWVFEQHSLWGILGLIPSPAVRLTEPLEACGTLPRSRRQTPVCLFLGCYHGDPRRKLFVGVVILHFTRPPLPQLTFIHSFIQFYMSSKLLCWELHTWRGFTSSLCGIFCTCMHKIASRLLVIGSDELREDEKSVPINFQLPKQLLYGQFANIVHPKETSCPLNNMRETNWHRWEAN